MNAELKRIKIVGVGIPFKLNDSTELTTKNE